MVKNKKGHDQNIKACRLDIHRTSCSLRKNTWY